MRYFLAIFLSFSSLLLATTPQEDGIDVSETEGLPSSIVNGVCVISGGYTAAQADIIVPGPESLVFQRHYSSDVPGGQFGLGWGINHDEKIEVQKFSEGGVNERSKPFWLLTLSQSSGTQLTYEHAKKGKDHRFLRDNKKVELDLNVPRGLTNGAHLLSGRTNLNNQTIAYEGGSRDQFRMKTGAGNRKLFSIHGKKHGFEEFENIHYILKYEIKPNGSKYDYHHQEDDLYHINCKSRETKKLFNAIRIEKIDQGKEKFSKKLITSDGRFIDYQFKYKKYKNSANQESKDYLCLTDVSSPFVVDEHYSYEEDAHGKSPHLVKIRRPDGRFQKIDYYHYKNNMLVPILDVEHLMDPLNNVNLSDKKDYRINRVRTLEAPVGTGPEPIRTHYFYYKCKVSNRGKEDEKLNKGTTTVLDAYKNQTTYKYDNRHRLTHVSRFSGASNPLLYSQEEFIWDDKRGNLKGKVLADAQGNVHYGKFYAYDRHGNVLKSTLGGSLTGLPCHPLVLDSDGNPCFNPYEREEKYYTYTDDDLNLVATEKDSNGITTSYLYVKDRDLVKAKLISDETGIFLREFYDYTLEGILSCKIVDDGKGLDLSDLSYITERHITRYSHTQGVPYGLPECVIESYLDCRTGIEHSLKTTYSLYSMAGKLIRQDIHDATGAFAYSLFWTYDERGNVTEEVNALGEKTLRTYDENNNLIIEQLPNGTVVTNTYDFSNRLIRQVEKHVNNQTFVMTHAYNYLNQCIQTIDPYGNEKNQTFDEFGRVIKTTCPIVYNENHEIVQPVVHTNYNIAGQMMSLCDAKGRYTYYKYNIRNQLTEIIYPDQTVERMIYSLDGQLTDKMEKNGNHIYYLHDKRGRLLGEHIYDANNNFLKSSNHVHSTLHLLSTTDGEEFPTQYHYDAAGRLEWTIRGSQKQQTLYDALGRIAEVREWFGEGEQDYTRTVKMYDVLGRMLEERVETSIGEIVHLTKTQYDSQGNKIFVQVGDQITWTEYDGHGNPTKITNALGQSTYTVYDTAFINDIGQRVLQTRTTDPLGYQTIQTHDAANRLVEVHRKNPFGVVVAYQITLYDLCGNQVRVYNHVMEEGETTRVIETYYQYDNGNRVTALIEASGTPEQKITHYQYNPQGLKSVLIKPDGIQIFYHYDALDRLKMMQSSEGSIDYSYTYNRRDDLISAEDHRNKQVTSYYYNVEGRLIAESLGHGLALHYNYDRLGRITQVILPDESGIDYEYKGVDLKAIHRTKLGQRQYTHQNVAHNLAGQVTQVKLANEADEIHYNYDVLGRCITIQSTHFNQNIPMDGFDAAGNLKLLNTQEQSSQFNYDDHYQLNHEQGQMTHDYRLDSIGNRKVKDGENYSYNALNQLQQAGQEVFSYDLNGNIRKRVLGNEEINYIFDALDRLVSVTQNGQTTNYTYDPMNRRLTKEGQTTEYFMYLDKEEIGVWAGQGIKELRLLGEESRNPMVAIELEGIMYLPIHDLTGNIACLLNERGEVVENYRYTAYGESEIYDPQGQKIAVSLVNNPWQYASKRLDAESGLIAFGLRYYDPKIGRWISPDPIGFEDGPNLYAYVHNSPLTSFDQFGLFSIGPVMTNFTTNFIQDNFEQALSQTANKNPVKFVDEEAYIRLKYPAHIYNHPDHWNNEVLPHTGCPELSCRYSLNNMRNLETGQNYSTTEDRNHRIIFVNGIDNTYSDVKSSAAYLSGLAGGYNIRGVHSPTWGFMTDVRYALNARGSIAYNAIGLLKEEADDFFKHANPDAKLLLIGHSRGVIYINRFLDIYPEELRMRIIILAVAPADIINPKRCLNVKHYVCSDDPVVVHSGVYNKSVNKKYVESFTYLRRDPSTTMIGNHSINSITYQANLQEDIARYKRH